MFTELLLSQARELLDECRSKHILLAIAESCTGGLLSALLTEIPGASSVLERGFVTYSNRSKHEMLAVDSELIAEHGAISEAVAEAMAKGALAAAKVDVSVAITGIAGPGGGTPQKPVGLVFIAVASRSDVVTRRYQFSGDRLAVRMQSVQTALQMLKATTNALRTLALA